MVQPPTVGVYEGFVIHLFQFSVPGGRSSLALIIGISQPRLRPSVAVKKTNNDDGFPSDLSI